jgi:hypothetical protein
MEKAKAKSKPKAKAKAKSAPKKTAAAAEEVVETSASEVAVIPGVGVGDGEGVGLGVAVGTGVGVGDGEGVGLGVAVGTGVGVGDGEGVGLGVAVGTGVAVGAGDGVAVGVAVGLGAEEGATEGSGNSEVEPGALVGKAVDLEGAELGFTEAMGFSQPAATNEIDPRTTTMRQARALDPTTIFISEVFMVLKLLGIVGQFAQRSPVNQSFGTRDDGNLDSYKHSKLLPNIFNPQTLDSDQTLDAFRSTPRIAIAFLEPCRRGHAQPATPPPS